LAPAAGAAGSAAPQATRKNLRKRKRGIRRALRANRESSGMLQCRSLWGGPRASRGWRASRHARSILLY
jgi:hypothetical protein